MNEIDQDAAAFFEQVAQKELLFSGRMTAYEHKHLKPGDPVPNIKPAEAVRKAWILDAQWSDCPVEIEDIVRQLWRMNELGNDRYILKLSIEDMVENYADEAEAEVWQNEEPRGWVNQKIDFVTLAAYLRSKGIKDDEDVWIHWWW